MIFLKVESKLNIEIPPFPFEITNREILSTKSLILKAADQAFILPHEQSEIIGDFSSEQNMIFKINILPTGEKISNGNQCHS
jgi:hypothetical protein